MKNLILILAFVISLPLISFAVSKTADFDDSGNLTVAGICLSGVCNTSWPAGGAATIASSTATSASDSNNKTITAWCPSGYRATGGGGQMLAGANTDIHMENSYPTATTSGWIVSFNEGDAVAANWQIKAYVLCIQ